MSRDALVVGINHYANAPVNDARAIADILKQQGNFRVKRLLGTDAQRPLNFILLHLIEEIPLQVPLRRRVLGF